MQSSAGPLREQLADPESRLRKLLPLVGGLSLRFAVTLLRRVAARIEESGSVPDTPDLVKRVAARTSETNRNLADIIEQTSQASDDENQRKP